MERDEFVDLEKLRLEIIKEKVQFGIEDIECSPTKQWTTLRLEKPLLETLLKLIESNN